MLRLWYLPMLFFLTTAPVPVPASEALCLWTATKDDQTHYLLGSVHVLKASDYPLPTPILRAYGASTKLIFEADIEALNSPATQARVREVGMYPREGNQTLFTELPKETAEGLRYVIARRRLPAEAFAHQRPWLAAITLPMLELQRMGYSPIHGVDQYFHRRATSAEKSLGFLETPTFQLDLLSGLPPEEQVELLQKTLVELENAEKDFGILLSAWRSGNTEALYRAVSKGLMEHPELKQKLLIDRNRSWIPKLTRWFSGEERCLVIVGAGHLVGPESVVEGLRAVGWTVEQHGRQSPIPAGTVP